MRISQLPSTLIDASGSRQLGNKNIYTDEGIEQATEQLAKSAGGKNIRRMARGSG